MSKIAAININFLDDTRKTTPYGLQLYSAHHLEFQKIATALGKDGRLFDFHTGNTWDQSAVHFRVGGAGIAPTSNS